jgi:tetratricopeptide (TPR) repeat protein
MDKNKQEIPLNIASYLTVITVALLPVFFLPSLPLALSKLTLAYLATSLSLVFIFFFLVRTETKMSLPKLIVFVPILLILLVTLLSAWFSKLGFSFSAVGYGIEVDTLSFLFLLFSLLGLSTIIFQKKRFTYLFYRLFLGSFFLVFIFQLLKTVIGLDFSFFGFFPSKTSTLLGNWNELGFLAGAVLILITLSLSGFLRGGRRINHILLLLISLAVLVVVNFWLAWLALAIVLLLLILIEVRNGREVSLAEDPSGGAQENTSPRPKKFYLTLITFLVALVFILPLGNLVKEPIYNFLEVSFVEVGPSWSGSGKILGGTLKEDSSQLLLGSGPGSFSYQWRLFKPLDVNLTDFWNTNFDYAKSLMATLATTTGLLGLLSWLLFLLSFFFLGFNRFFIRRKPINSIALSSFLLATYFWLIFILYNPSVSLLLFGAVFSGIFLASLIKEGSLGAWTIPTKGLKGRSILISVSVLVLALSLLLSFISFEKSLARFYFERGLRASGGGDVALAEQEFLKALRLSENDVYRRAFSQFYSSEANKLLSDPNLTTPSATEIEALRSLLLRAVDNARQATTLNPQSRQNWLALGALFESLVSLRVEGAYENALGTYEEARSRDPLNPSIDLSLARVELSASNIDQAEQFIRVALEKKPNYSQAFFLLSRIELFKGNLENATALAQNIVALNPREPTAYFHLGLLYYQGRNFAGADAAFNQAVLLEPLYSNARYFLGLSLYEMGEVEASREQFDILAEQHPDNSELKLILENLEAGQEPLFQAEPPLEERTELPLGDDE